MVGVSYIRNEYMVNDSTTQVTSVKLTFLGWERQFRATAPKLALNSVLLASSFYTSVSEAVRRNRLLDLYPLLTLRSGRGVCSIFTPSVICLAIAVWWHVFTLILNPYVGLLVISPLWCSCMCLYNTELSFWLMRLLRCSLPLLYAFLQLSPM